jgi:hypothetical protein
MNDIVWHNRLTNETQLWLMDGHQVKGRATVLGEDGRPALVGDPFSIVGTGVFEGSTADLVWHNRLTNETQLWLMDGHQVKGRATVLGEDGRPALVGDPFSIVGTGVFDATTDGPQDPAIGARTKRNQLGYDVDVSGRHFSPGGTLILTIEGLIGYQGSKSMGRAVASRDGTFHHPWSGKTWERGGSAEIKCLDATSGRSASCPLIPALY